MGISAIREEHLMSEAKRKTAMPLQVSQRRAIASFNGGNALGVIFKTAESYHTLQGHFHLMKQWDNLLFEPQLVGAHKRPSLRICRRCARVAGFLGSPVDWPGVLTIT